MFLAKPNGTSSTMLDELSNFAGYINKEQFHAVLSDIIEKVSGDRDGKRINRIEKALTRVQIKTWNGRANRAAKAAVASVGGGKRKFSKADAAKVLRILDKNFKGIDNTLRSRVQRDIEQIHRVSKSQFVRRFKLKVPKKTRKAIDPEVAFAIGLVDEATMAAVAELQIIAIGNHFPVTLRPEISKLIKTGVLDKGLNKEKAGLFLQKELTRKLGTTAFKSSVPESFLKRGVNGVNQYFTGLSATHVNFARNFSSAIAMDEAEIAKYQIVTVPDKRRSVICTQMDGRIFELSVAKEHMQVVMDAADVDQLKQDVPWRKDLSEFGLTEGKKLKSPTAARVLAASGMGMPPYHFRCRTEVHPA